MSNLTHNEILNRRFKCDDGIWRTVFRYENGKYIMVMPNSKTKKNGFVPVPVGWFSGRDSEVK